MKSLLDFFSSSVFSLETSKTIPATTEAEKNINCEEKLTSFIFKAVDRMTTEMIFD